MDLQEFTLNSLLNILLQNYFVGYKCVHYIINGNQSCVLAPGNSSVVVDKIGNVSDVELKVCDAFVVQVDSPDEIFRAIGWQISHRKTNKYSFRRYLFLVSNDVVDNFALMNHTSWVFDLLFLCTSKHSGLFELYYFKNPNSVLKKELVDVWCSYNRTFLSNGIFFPDKMKGQVFNVGTFNYPPYINLHTMHGIELRLLQEYCRRKDLTLKLIYYPDNSWGDVFEDWTGFDLMGGVLNQVCHVGIAGFYWQTKKPYYYDYIVPVVRAATSCIVPVPTLETSLMIAFLPFDRETWIFVFLAFMAIVCVWKICVKVANGRQSTAEIVFVILKLMLQQPINIKHSIGRNVYLERFLVLALILMVLISIAYPSILFKLMRSPRYRKPIFSVDDLQESDIEWGTTHIGYVDILPKDKYARLFKKLVITDEKSLLQLLEEKRFALVIEHLNNGYVPPTGVDLLKYMTLKRDMLWLWVTMLLPINSVWQPSLQMHTLEVHASGLDKFWEKEAFHEMGLSMYQRQLKSHDVFELSPLSMWQIRGVFLILGTGLTISCIVFLYEYFWCKFLFSNWKMVPL